MGFLLCMKKRIMPDFREVFFMDYPVGSSNDYIVVGAYAPHACFGWMCFGSKIHVIRMPAGA
ncbi:MAG: hypothetical protein DRI46_10105 [Chloroflexi bacterium]|nr:MAG: hypothetical protein DRI46_10105 [Chloroflexota bacterium]